MEFDYTQKILYKNDQDAQMLVLRPYDRIHPPTSEAVSWVTCPYTWW